MIPTKFFSLTVIATALLLSPSWASAQSSDPNAPLATGKSTSRPVSALPRRTMPVQVLPPLSLADISAEVANRLSKLVGVRAVNPVPDAPNFLRLIAHNDTLVRLDPLVERLNAAGADREAEYRRIEANTAVMLTRTDPFTVARLRVVIRNTASVDAFELESAAGDMRNLIVRRAFIGDLEEVVVGDTPTTIALMPASRLTDLQLSADQAFEQGRMNTINELASVAWRPVNGVLEARVGTGYETSLLALDAQWASLAQQLGGPIAVIVPTRKRLVVGRADRPRDIARLQAIINAEFKGSRALSNKIWLRRGTTWVER